MESVITVFWQVWAMLGQVRQVLWYFPWHHLIDIGLMTFSVYQAYIRFRGTEKEVYFPARGKPLIPFPELIIYSS